MSGPREAPQVRPEEAPSAGPREPTHEPEPEEVFRCPGCGMEWRPSQGGIDYALAAFKSHRQRHAHAS